jgi:hypothetical protein
MHLDEKLEATRKTLAQAEAMAKEQLERVVWLKGYMSAIKEMIDADDTSVGPVCSPAGTD